MGTQQQREDLSILKPWQGQNRFLERVFGVGAFRELYLARMREFSRTLFVPERFHRQVDEVAAAIRPAIAEESTELLARLDRVVAGQPVGMFVGNVPGGEPAAGGAPGNQPRFGPPGAFGQPPKPIKGFVVARAKSVTEQLSGQSSGQTLEGFGFGGPRPVGGGGRNVLVGPGGPGGPGDFGPGTFLGPLFMDALDTDKDGVVTRVEFEQGFDRWFRSWNKTQSGMLTAEQLRAGINREFTPFRQSE